MLEEYRLEAFENGYRSGWDDATHAHAESQTSISAELAQNLRDLSFTYHEARDHLLGGLAPLFRGIVETMLPALADHSARKQPAAQQLEEIARNRADQPVVISVAPESCERVRAILDDNLPMDVSVLSESTLGDGQARIGFGDEERKSTSPTSSTRSEPRWPAPAHRSLRRKPMTDGPESSAPATVDLSSPFSAVPVEITVSVGKARPTVQELLQMGENTVLALDRKVEDPVELFVGDQLIARGELEECPGDPGRTARGAADRWPTCKDRLG